MFRSDSASSYLNDDSIYFVKSQQQKNVPDRTALPYWFEGEVPLPLLVASGLFQCSQNALLWVATIQNELNFSCRNEVSFIASVAWY